MSRIQHAEDLIFWEGISGVERVVNAFENINKDLYKNVSLKWDGSPAVIFGKDENGDFVFTDKGGFVAKGYDGKAKSPEHLENILKNRGSKNVDDSRMNFINNMKNSFKVFKGTFPDNISGYFVGDLLYFNRPEIIDGKFVFKPNVVRYEVDVNSELGNKINKSKVGIVLHKHIDLNGNTSSVKSVEQFKGDELLVIPQIFAKQPPGLDLKSTEEFSELSRIYKDPKIDEFFNQDTLSNLKIKNLPDVLYAYTNHKVDTGFENLGNDFIEWLKSKNISKNKFQNISDYITEHKDTFSKIWKIVELIHEIKVKIIDKLENQESWPVKSYIGDKRGGEGFVLSDKDGDLKLVSRKNFSVANRQVVRETNDDIVSELTRKLINKLNEGGWLKPELTSGTKLTPSIIELTNKKFDKFLSDLNDFLESKKMLPITDHKILGSAKYYKQDLINNPDKMYGDIDIMIVIPQDDDETNKNKIIKEYSDKILEFINDSDQSYIDKESAERSKGKQIIIKIDDSNHVQVDMLYVTKSYKDWFSTRFSPERGIKGFTIGLLYTSLAETLNIRIGDSGVRAKFKDNSIVNPALKSGTIEKIISKNPNTFLLDIVNFLSNLFGIKMDDIDSDLKSYPGVKENDIKIESLAKGIRGLAKTLENSGILKKLNTNYSNFIDNVKSKYEDKLKDKIKKVSKKSNSEETINAMNKIKSHAEIGSKIINSVLNEQSINEGGNVFDNVSPFKREESNIIINSLNEILPEQLKFIVVGSAGQKDISGDMDVMTDADDLIEYFNSGNIQKAKQDLKQFLIKNGFESKVIGTNVHIKVPVKGTDRFAQVDVMVIENASNISKYHIHDYSNTKYKGRDKHIILSSLAKHTKTKKFPEGFTWSPFQGLKDRKTKKIITSDLDKVAKILLANKNASSDDLRSVESILSKVKDKNKLKDAIELLQKDGRPIEI